MHPLYIPSWICLCGFVTNTSIPGYQELSGNMWGTHIAGTTHYLSTHETGCCIQSRGIGILADPPLDAESVPYVLNCRIGPAWQGLVVAGRCKGIFEACVISDCRSAGKRPLGSKLVYQRSPVKSRAIVRLDRYMIC